MVDEIPHSAMEKISAIRHIPKTIAVFISELQQVTVGRKIADFFGDLLVESIVLDECGAIVLLLLLCETRHTLTVHANIRIHCDVHINTALIRCGYLSCNIATSQVVCRISVSISQVTLILLV